MYLMELLHLDSDIMVRYCHFGVSSVNYSDSDGWASKL